MRDVSHCVMRARCAGSGGCNAGPKKASSTYRITAAASKTRKPSWSMTGIRRHGCIVPYCSERRSTPWIVYSTPFSTSASRADQVNVEKGEP